MKADWYTKGVLTVIAAALLYICVAVTPISNAVTDDEPAGRPVYVMGWVDEHGMRHPLPTAGQAANDLEPRALPVTPGAK